MILKNLWSSIVVGIQQEVAQFKLDYPNTDIQFVDWETHANVNELPNADCIGPTSLTFTEVSPQMVEVNFAIGVSTHGDDHNLFRLRHMVAVLYEKYRVGTRHVYFDADTAAVISYMKSVDGTMVAPMSRADVRPFQYIQVEMLLDPGAV